MGAVMTASGTDFACTKFVQDAKQDAKKKPKLTTIAAKSSVLERISFL
jgi:hypothetical protein